MKKTIFLIGFLAIAATSFSQTVRTRQYFHDLFITGYKPTQTNYRDLWASILFPAIDTLSVDRLIGIDELSNDPTLADSSSRVLITEAAVKAYVDARVGGIDSLVLLQDSILVAYDAAGSEVWRDTIAGTGGEDTVTDDLDSLVSASYDGANLTLTLVSGQTIVTPLANVVSGLSDPVGAPGTGNRLYVEIGDSTLWLGYGGAWHPFKAINIANVPAGDISAATVQGALNELDSEKLSAEVDGSVTNEGALSVGAAGANTSQIATNTSGDGGIILKAGTGVSLSESADTITITGQAAPTASEGIFRSTNDFRLGGTYMLNHPSEFSAGRKLNWGNFKTYIGTDNADSLRTFVVDIPNRRFGFNIDPATAAGDHIIQILANQDYVLGIRNSGNTFYRYELEHSVNPLLRLRNSSTSQFTVGWDATSSHWGLFTNSLGFTFREGTGGAGTSPVWNVRSTYTIAPASPSTLNRFYWAFNESPTFSANAGGEYRMVAFNPTIVNNSTNSQTTVQAWFSPSISGTAAEANTAIKIDNSVGTGINQSNTAVENSFMGNTGIGVAAASVTQKLHVSGNARITGAYYDSNNDSGTSGQILVSSVTGTDWQDFPPSDTTLFSVTTPFGVDVINQGDTFVLEADSVIYNGEIGGASVSDLGTAIDRLQNGSTYIVADGTADTITIVNEIYTVTVNTNSNPETVRLPAPASAYDNVIVIVKQIGSASNAITISAVGGASIFYETDATSTSSTISAGGNSKSYQCVNLSGTRYWIVI